MGYFMSVTIRWFRNDLRLSDNPAHTKAARTGKVLPVYIWKTKSGKKRSDTFRVATITCNGRGNKLWLHYALNSLQSDLQDKLILRRGSAEHIMENLSVKQVHNS